MARAATRYPEDRAKIVEDIVKVVRGSNEHGSSSSRAGGSSNQAIAAALPQVSGWSYDSCVCVCVCVEKKTTKRTCVCVWGGVMCPSRAK